jgi:hypothetical protein
MSMDRLRSFVTVEFRRPAPDLDWHGYSTGYNWVLDARVGALQFIVGRVRPARET